MHNKTTAQDAFKGGALAATSKLATPLVLVIAMGGCQTKVLEPEYIPNQEPPRASASILEQPPVAAPEQVSEQVSEQISEQVPEQISEQVPEQTKVIQNPNAPPDASPDDSQLPANDLITVIRDGLILDDVDNVRVRAKLRYYNRRQSYFTRVLERAAPYLYHIVHEVRRRGMPMDLALLPVVESAFDPFAYSFARAAGLWQFIPSTGRHYGLEQNWWYDGRRDVIAATDAALTFLEDLHAEFDDWELALAAYNSGRGTVRNAIRRNKKAGKPTDFWSLSLPRETSAYVPKMLAISKVFRHPEKYGVTLNPIANTPYFEPVHIGQQTDLSRAANLAGMELEELHRLNPAFNRWATGPNGPHHLLIPVALAGDFKEALADLPMEKRLAWQHYNIRSGDNLIKIAKRFSTTVELVREINQISGSKIVAGKSLLIPVPSASHEDYTLATTQRQGAPHAGRKKINYIVQTGDSFWDIARDHKVSVKSLAAWNSMAPRDILQVGQKLVIWTEKTRSNSLGVVRKVYYRVRNGDNLWVIAKRFGVRVGDIRSWNTLNAKYLQPGDTLTLLVDVTKSL